ncbi:hypothetical protein HDV06_003319 [Boothiomyces sp. JEL0866]|nr:hypothetical protein HDV06_003319 [Boothiomyces sp. JEL0866]
MFNNEERHSSPSMMLQPFKDSDYINLKQGIYKIKDTEILIDSIRSRSNWFYSNDKQRVYIFGLVDILQKYNTNKILEKGLKRSNSKLNSILSNKIVETEHSVEEPELYAQRLIEFANKNLVR